MRLLTHNTLKNNSAEAKGKGFPLKITATEIRVDETQEEVTEQQMAFVKNILSRLEWTALVQVRAFCNVGKTYLHLCPIHEQF